jgi:hypothetical protein
MLDLKDYLNDNMGLVAIAVGTAEGTRTPDGSFTKAYWGHKDPSNRKFNQGSFSYQHSAKNPQEADCLQLHKLKNTLLPAFNIACSPFEWSESDRLILFVTACDVFTQSEAACCLKGGFLDLIPHLPGLRQIVNVRVDAYMDPRTHRIDAPGVGNDRNRLFSDQLRRQECLMLAIAHYQQTKATC